MVAPDRGEAMPKIEWPDVVSRQPRAVDPRRWVDGGVAFAQDALGARRARGLPAASCAARHAS